MGPVLNGLIKLQSIENRLRAIKSKLARSRRSVIFLENQVRTLQSQSEAKKEEIKLTRVQCDRLELELKTRDVEVAKLRTALNTAKTNKDYSAILSQMNTYKADNSKIETQVLDLFKNIESDEQQCNEIQTKIAEEKEKLEQLRKDSETKSEQYEKEIALVEAEWQNASKEIPKAVLEIFNRVADTYDGEAIANAEQQQGSEVYTCGGCFMTLRLDIINQLMTKDDVIRCPSCTRIVVIEEYKE
jgi:predicted  nucleic acid-binding Zn-ribbon protein